MMIQLKPWQERISLLLKIRFRSADKILLYRNVFKLEFRDVHREMMLNLKSIGNMFGVWTL